MKTNPDKLLGWNFEEEEISAGVYRVVAVDCMGRKVERTGTDLEKLRAECRRDVENIQQNLIEGRTFRVELPDSNIGRVQSL